MRLIASLLLALPLVAQDLSSEQTDRVARAVEAQRAAQKIPAVSLAIAHGGKIAYAKAFGTADLENDVAATTASLFRTASIAKPLTATAVMQLAEQGKLDLDAPIRKYVPKWPEKHASSTCRQLLAHIGGVRHYKFSGEASGTKAFFDLESTLGLFKDDALVAPPGTKFSYTTFGYTLLGLAVERASGQPFVVYMEKNVFGKAGMTHTGADNTFMLLKHRARGYQKLARRDWSRMPKWIQDRVKPGEIFNANLHDTSMKIPGGGFLSTPTDLCRFAVGMMSGRLVKQETRDAMWTRQKTEDGKEIRYGLGWNVGTASGQPMISHSGGQAGTSCYLVMLPKSNVAVAAMTNLRGANVRAIVEEVSKLLIR